jgi:hypothetical protein
MAPETRVVAALQAPTLLNRLALSPLWRLEVATFGLEAFAEKSLLLALSWDGRSEGVDWVLVCTDDQLQWARSTFPRARVAWAAHCSLPGVVTHMALRDADAIVTFCRRNEEVLRPHVGGKPQATLLAAYHPRLKWRWTERTAWTMASRPQHRVPWWCRTMDAALAHARASLPPGTPLRHEVYGEDQPGGFLTGEARRAVERRSSCYLSRCVENTGMGLVEHECWEMGSPVVGCWAGDLYDGIPQERMNDDFLGCLLVESCARAHSERGMQHLLDTRTEEHRDRSIERLLDLPR